MGIFRGGRAMQRPWSELSREEKRQKRFEVFLHPPGVIFRNTECEQAYRRRAKRLIDVYNVERPDQVPVFLHVGAMPAYYCGMDYKTVMYNYEKAVSAWRRFNEELDLDYVLSPGMILPGKVYDLLDYRLYRWPGHGLADDAMGYQFVEGEYMKEDEYDLLLRDPSDFLTRVYMPRVFGVLGPYRMLRSLVSVVELPVFYFLPYSNSALQSSLKALLEVGQEIALWMRHVSEFVKERMELGHPFPSGVLVKAPFDILGDTLRGTRGIMQDMYRRQDRLLAALDVLAEMTIEYAISTLNERMGLMATFPLHKGADGWMSERQFESFYWPSLRKVIARLVEEGVLVSLFAEGSFETRLEKMNEFPRGAVHWMFDRTDMRKAKEVLGDRCSISGGIPGSLLVTGTPSQVEAYCRDLIETCGKDGGFILCAGTADVTEAKLENVRAMIDGAKKYGTYEGRIP